MKLIARNTLLLLLGFVCLAQTVTAEEAASDAVVDADADLAAAAEAVTAASEAAQVDEAEVAKKLRNDKKKAAKKKKRSMQSCLTLVRSYYGKETDFVQGFMDEHPTTDKNRLLSKILSQMMIKCSGLINDEQVAHLQQFKLNALDADWQQEGYPELI